MNVTVLYRFEVYNGNKNRGVNMKGNLKPVKRKNGIIGRIISIALLIIFIPLIVVNIILIANAYINPDHLPGAFGYKPMIVYSGSMEPEFAAGDLILISQTGAAEVKQGDVICFLTEGHTAVTHRVTKVKEFNDKKIYVTKGDANNTEDTERVEAAQIEGVYTGIHIAKLGNLLMFMQTTTGMILFIICPLILYILYDVVRHMMDRKEEQEHTAMLEAELEALRTEKQGNSKQGGIEK